MRVFVCLVLLLAIAVKNPAQETETDHPFRFGFSSVLMPEVNENDARAAMKVWAETVVRSGMVRADPNVLFSHDSATLLAGLRSRTVDGVAVSTSEFLALRDQVQFNRYVFAVIDGNIWDEYILLVHQDGGLAKIEDLRGHTLNLQHHSRTCLATPWLDTLLREKGLSPTRDFFSQVLAENKLTKAVLPVFFRKIDACLVTRKGFKTMGELNPQVSRQLRVLAASPPIVPTGFFFRTGFPQAQQDRCLAEFTRVHTSPSGQQILTVFQTERLEEHPASVLDSAIELLAKHERLCGGTNAAPFDTARLARDPAKGLVQ